MTDIIGNRSPPHSALHQASRLHSPQLPSQYMLNLNMLIVDYNPAGRDIHADPAAQYPDSCCVFKTELVLKPVFKCRTTEFNRHVTHNSDK